MGKGLETFQPIFGEMKGEWESSLASQSSSLPPLLPFLFHVYARDSSSLGIQLTDFHSYTWEIVRTIQQLEDLRDIIGIGGSWLEFVDYLVASISSGNVKLVLGGVLNSTGATSGKFVAHKSKGMPLISISLRRVLNSSANDAMANLSLELFKAFKEKHNAVVREQAKSMDLTMRLDAERDKNAAIQKKLDTVAFSSKRKQQQKESDKALPTSVLDISETQQSPDKASYHDPQSMKVGRNVPAYRRVKVRGALLQDNEDNDGK